MSGYDGFTEPFTRLDASSAVEIAIQEGVVVCYPTCKTCRHWTQVGSQDLFEKEAIRPMEPVTLKRAKNAEEERAISGYNVRRCAAPLVVFYQRPARNGAAVFDGSEYAAELYTGEDFGCPLHELSS